MKRWKARRFWPLNRAAVGLLGNRPSVHCLYSAILDYAGGLGLVVQPGAVVMCGLLVVGCGHLQSLEARGGGAWLVRHCAEVGAMQGINSVARGPGGSSRQCQSRRRRAAGLSCRAGPARGRGDADGGAEEQQVSQGWLVEQTAWSTELSPGGLAYFLQ